MDRALACGFASPTLHDGNRQVQKMSSSGRSKAGAQTGLLNPRLHGVSELPVGLLEGSVPCNHSPSRNHRQRFSCRPCTSSVPVWARCSLATGGWQRLPNLMGTQSSSLIPHKTMHMPVLCVRIYLLCLCRQRTTGDPFRTGLVRVPGSPTAFTGWEAGPRSPLPAVVAPT